MREITVAGKKYEITGLTRKQIKAGKDFGFSVLGCIPTFETADAAFEHALSCVLAPSEIRALDNVPNMEQQKFWKAILAETYGDRSEEKNSASTSDGTLTQSA